MTNNITNEQKAKALASKRLCTLWFVCIELYVLPHDERGQIHPGTKG